MTTAEGHTLRAEGQSATLAADVAPHRGFAADIRSAIDGLARWSKEPWTCDEVRRVAADIARVEGRDFTPSDNLLPAIIGGYVGAGRIVRVSDARSTRASRHASRVGQYLGARYVQEAS